MEVIVSQEEELAMFLQDHQNYLEELERVALAYKQNQAERALLVEYNGELEKQINEVETHNSSLESWVIKAHDELQSQNEQSGDLLCQVE